VRAIGGTIAGMTAFAPHLGQARDSSRNGDFLDLSLKLHPAARTVDRLTLEIKA